jgi:Arc/MetJ-type ribon-helix-helix transcriptional regulator
MKTTNARQKSTKKVGPKSNASHKVKIKNKRFSSISEAIRFHLLKDKDSTYREIADLCGVTYPLVYTLAQEMNKKVMIGKEEHYESVIAATVKLGKTHPINHIVKLCEVSRPCIETIIKVKNL